MARTRAQIQADIDALLAIPAGIEKVRHEGKETVFLSETDKAKALARLKRELNGVPRISYSRPR